MKQDFDDIAISIHGYIGPLSASGTTICGDSVCNGTETCQSCSLDCPTGSGEVCCSGVVYTGNCCEDANCTAPETCNTTTHTCISPPQCEQDQDGDGYGVGPSCLGPDCNDSDQNVHANITCLWDGSQCGSFSLCLQTCPIPPTEICTNSQDDDCDSLIDCQDPDCSQDPACQTGGELLIFQDSLPSGSNIGSGDPMAVSTSNPYQGTSNLEITGQGAWSNCRIENLNLDMTPLNWQNSYLEFAVSSPVALGYVAVNLFGDGNKASEQVISLTGSGNYETIQINMTDFSSTQAGFGDSLTMFMIGSDWGSSTIYLDEVKVVSPGSYHRADNNPQDGCITMQELLAFIDLWKISSQDVSMPELMEAIGLWKQGTGCS